MSKMEETTKFLTCPVGGCTMRFTNPDNLTIHKKKHDMVLNIGTGQKTNVFVADQTPTPTRFIRNCEEVGLFQDLQNVNPFEETFRKAVEASREGGSHLEAQSLHIPAAADDTLHTPHVFPNITEEHSSITNLISSASLSHAPSGEKSQSSGLESLQVPTNMHSEPAVVEVTDTSDFDTDIQIKYQGNSKVFVKQEANENSQQQPSQESSLDSQCKIPTTTAHPQDTVQVVFQMPDGHFVQLSGVSMDSVPSTQLPVQVPHPVLQSAASSRPSIAPTPVIINTQFVQTTARLGQVSTVAQHTAVSHPTTIPRPSLSIGDTATSLQARLSVAKMKLKQRLQFNSKRKQTLPLDVQANKISLKRGIGQQMFLDHSSEGSDTSSSASSKGKRLSFSTHEVDEQRLRFRERNRAAAMRCREKRKHWILELEKRSDETQKVNQQLSSEITKLRSELVHLKTLLLAHKDCPVTKAMQHGTVNVYASPEDTQPKVVLLSKPAGLKRRRQAALAALAGIDCETNHTKDSEVVQSQTTHVLTLTQPMPWVPATHQITNGNHPEDMKLRLITDSVTSSPQTCLITVTAPTLLSAGVPAQGIALKSNSLTSTSYMPTKLCVPSTDSTLSQIMKLNSTILKKSITETVTKKTTHSNGDSVDSGHGSDIEI